MALKYKRILLKLSGEVLKGSSDSCHDEAILAEVAQPFDAREAIRLMGQGTVALFAGDTGNPFFSTDSGAALRAAEIGANALLKATKVDGIYSADPATGRIAESDGFAWDYLAGSNLKSKLTYPNGATASWDYEANRDLLTKVTNAHADGTGISSYTYTNDLLGRRTSKNDEQYGYNVRDELIAADEVSYNYDDIGNRTTAEGKTYTANNLNQYTAIDDFTPQYDADGNQTLIKTPTGIWSVTYNAENRPIRWTRDDTIVTMTFDRIGRRVDYYETRAGQVATHFRFVYDNFLCVQRLNAANGNAVRTEFVWDPTEPIATRPLVMRAKNWDLNLFYTHDGNKNVSEVFYHALQNGIAAHYDYAPFGAVTRTSSATRVTNRDLLSENPFRFSSEVHDAPLDLVYYNYRHYNPSDGQWIGRDRSINVINLFGFVENNPIVSVDMLGNEILVPPERFSPFLFLGFRPINGLIQQTQTLAQARHRYSDEFGNAYPTLGEQEDCTACINGKEVKGKKFQKIEKYKVEIWVDYDRSADLESNVVSYNLNGQVGAMLQRYTIVEHELKHLDNYVQMIKMSLALINNAGSECIPSECSQFLKSYIQERLIEYSRRQDMQNMKIHYDDYPLSYRPSIINVKRAVDAVNEKHKAAEQMLKHLNACKNRYFTR